MTISVGDRIPEINLTTMTNEGPVPVSFSDLFQNKRVALFAVPGAFTPTCSQEHLPGFVNLAQQLSDKGIDTVACVSVNDVFVMDAWGKNQGADGKVLMLADGNGEFTAALGLELDASGFGMGTRSQRFSLVANDGVVEILNVEEGGFEVSSCEYMLEQI
ncbi:MAG: peroxiredoxin [Gammaproteobacteria bacterium]|jgi:peroxiredoxin|nr:peroxiredoxin [Gammaproteobacteria bacterium]MBT5216347.1 peroxiredoxin [Gammaproteobacteria bacterium]MBT5541837.1 peroxiredoxin [Gammaproteobacteria bacterium]MBT6074817.1 peroxiredoxin [Gammaproteobacteria bacterium]MBT7754459.1 peroxiredoxin [Gammaproteobacteria bacterium]